MMSALGAFCQRFVQSDEIVIYGEDDKSIELPMPQGIPTIDFDISKFSESKTEEVEGVMTYQDRRGNVAKQKVTLRAHPDFSVAAHTAHA